MRRFAPLRFGVAALMLGALSGCMNLDTGPETGGARPMAAQGMGPPAVPGVVGPYGTPITMAPPYNTAPPANPYMARQMMGNSVPMNMMQMNPGGIMSPVGVPGAPGMPPGMGNPAGPGAMPFGPRASNDNAASGDIVQAQFNAMNPFAGAQPGVGQRTQVRFLKPTGMEVSWFTIGADGKPTYSPTPISTPGRYNFVQGGRYRLKLDKLNLPGRPGVPVYPTLEVAPANNKTEAFLAHSSVPVEFTDEDLKSIIEGHYVVKVIYLPDPTFQDVAGTGTEEILSTRLEPGQDPIQEALRRGSILLVIRMGNVDQEAPNTPPLSAPAPGAAMGAAPPMKFGPTMPGMMTPPLQVPFWGMGPGGPLGPTPSANGLPPGMMPPPGMTPPPGMMPPGMMPPGMMPPGMMPPGMMAPPPGSMVPPGLAPSKVPLGAIPSPNNAAPPAPLGGGVIVPPPAGGAGIPLTPTPINPPAPKLEPESKNSTPPSVTPASLPGSAKGATPSIPTPSGLTPSGVNPSIPAPNGPPALPSISGASSPGLPALPTPVVPGLPK